MSFVKANTPTGSKSVFGPLLGRRSAESVASLRETEPEFNLYVTQVNIDPESPAMAMGLLWFIGILPGEA